MRASGRARRPTGRISEKLETEAGGTPTVVRENEDGQKCARPIIRRCLPGHPPLMFASRIVRS
jgi:hypothetical protein